MTQGNNNNLSLHNTRISFVILHFSRIIAIDPDQVIDPSVSDSYQVPITLSLKNKRSPGIMERLYQIFRNFAQFKRRLHRLIAPRKISLVKIS